MSVAESAEEQAQAQQDDLAFESQLDANVVAEGTALDWPEVEIQGHYDSDTTTRKARPTRQWTIKTDSEMYIDDLGATFRRNRALRLHTGVNS